MHRPELLVLDEPTSGLAPSVQQTFLAMIEEASENGQTVLLASHVLSEIERAAHRVAVLHRGKLVRLGALADMRLDRRRHVTATVRAERSRLEQGLRSLPVSDLGLEESMAGGNALVRLRATTDNVNDLIKVLAGYEVDDLTVTEPV